MVRTKRDEWVLIASHQLEDGQWMTLRRRVSRSQKGTEHDYRLCVAGIVLMETPHSVESARKLAEFAFGGVVNRAAPWVLVGGLGFGITLGAVLDLLPKNGDVIVSELYPQVVKWNRTHLVMLEGYRLDDPRLKVEVEDVATRIAQTHGQFDVILLDVDNGPVRFHRKDNDWLYSEVGLECAVRALTPGGVLGVWSAFDSAPFERRMVSAGLSVHRHEVKSARESAVIWCGYKR